MLNGKQFKKNEHIIVSKINYVNLVAIKMVSSSTQIDVSYT
jgi:hypothetical protein